MTELSIHPAAELFPMLSEEALTMLENNIKVDGQRMPIIVWNGAIVDGRNRYEACIRGGVKPRIKEVSFEDENECIRYIISTNIHRRHLNESQRASIASDLAELLPGNRDAQIKASPTMTQTQAAELMGVSRSSVQAAAKVTKEAPDLAAKVKSGEMKVSKAASIVRQRAKPAETDPSQAADSVIDAKDEANAMGYTAKMWSVWTAFEKLDATEQTAFNEQHAKKMGMK